jgi:hypothetical protein
MTQHCKYDDQVLDYVYGELAPEERTAFAAHLPACTSCRPQVDGMGQVRTQFREQPLAAPATDAMQRMTAVLMQEAAKAHGPALLNGVATAGPSGGGGQVIPFRPRGLRRVLLSPATGILSVAAAALFYVVVRSSAPTQAPAPTAAPAGQPVVAALTPPPAPAVAAAPTTTTAEAAKEIPSEPAAPAYAQAANQPSLELGTKSGRFVAEESSGKLAVRADGKKKSRDSLIGSLFARNDAKPSDVRAPQPDISTRQMGGGTGPTQSSSYGAAQTSPQATPEATSKQLVVAMADKNKDSAQDEYRSAQSGRFAAPPPVAAAPRAKQEQAPAAYEDRTVKGAIAQTQARRQEKVFEALSNQSLGQLGTGAGVVAQNSPRGNTWSSSDAPAVENRAAIGNSLDSDSRSGGFAQAPAVTAPARRDEVAAAQIPSTGREASNYGLAKADRGDAGEAVNTVQELVRKGRCAEAQTELARIERAFPAAPGLSSVQAQYQRSCEPSQQNNVLQNSPLNTPVPLEGNQERNYQQDSAGSGQQAERERQTMGMPSASAPASNRAMSRTAKMPAKPAAPSKAKGSSKAADLAL